MHKFQKYLPFLVSAILLAAAVCAIYPYLQYYVDPDGTAYLTLSKWYASGQYEKAINGYWSPWSCWLTAIAIKAGMSAIPASVLVNTTGALGFLYITYSLFARFRFTQLQHWLLLPAFSVFLCYAVYWQSFDDLWECFFLLLSLRIMLSRDFKRNFSLWILLGITGGLAYFAKAYAFPFFILNTIICTLALHSERKMVWLKSAAVALAVMFLMAIPWMYVLYTKYHIITISTAGKLNRSWYLVGHAFYRHEHNNFLVPAYPDSPYYWEDPYYVNGATPQFYTSIVLFIRQLARLIQNIFKFIWASGSLSIFVPEFFALALVFLLSKRNSSVTREMRVLLLSMLIFPAAYFMINFEARYIWYIFPLSIIWGVHLVRYLGILPGDNKALVTTLMLALSIIIVPVFGIRKMWHVGAADYAIAHTGDLPKGTFAATVAEGYETQRIARIAYFSGNQYLHYPGRFFEGVPVAAAREGIPYLYSFHPIAATKSYSLYKKTGDLYIYKLTGRNQ